MLVVVAKAIAAFLVCATIWADGATLNGEPVLGTITLPLFWALHTFWSSLLPAFMRALGLKLSDIGVSMSGAMMGRRFCVG